MVLVFMSIQILSQIVENLLILILYDPESDLELGQFRLLDVDNKL